MKKVIYLFVGILALMFAVSCDTNEDPVVLEESGVSFTITDLINNDLAAKDSDKISAYPECSEAPATEVHVTIDGVSYVIGMTSLGTNETEVLKLPAGPHTLSAFAVKDAGGNAIYVMPNASSDAATIYGLTGLPHTFVVGEFTKSKENVDVLCYNPASYALFGYTWFQYKVYEENEIFFFGDICSKFFEEWHLDPSTYAGQTTNEGYDFPAIFMVDILKNGAIVGTESNVGWYGEGKPLGISFINDPVLDENFEFVISLLMPDNSYVEVHRADLPDGSLSIEGDASGFGGADGVFDFAVGNCDSNQNIDANLVLPAWIPLPAGNINFTLSNSVSGTGASFFSNVVFNDLDGNATSGDTIGEWTEGAMYDAFCADPNVGIGAGPHNGVVFSSLDVAALPSDYQGYDWGKLNWIANNMDSYSDAEVQDAIWETIGTNANIGANNALAQAASGQSGFVPVVGDWAIVLLDAGNEGADLQLIIVRVDP